VKPLERLTLCGDPGAASAPGARGNSIIAGAFDSARRLCMTRTTKALTGGTCVWLAAALALAQPAWSQSTPSDRDRQPKTETEGQSSRGNLSDQLDRSKGVIQPPQTVDPGMQVTPPNPDARMPVIPPPGSRDGDQRVEPK
jgi:hypothetical protein